MRRPQRIVSLVPSLTEALFDLGAGMRIVGVTDYCISPPEVRAIRRIGGPRTPDLDAISALQPDLVITDTDECCTAHLDWLRERVPLRVFHCRCFADAYGILRVLGRITGTGVRADGFIKATEVERGRVAALWRTRRRVFYPVWKDPWMTISRGTFPSSVIAEAGGRSIFSERPEPYPRHSLEEALSREPDVVLLPDEPYAFGEAERHLFEKTQAYRHGAVRCVEGRWAAWYGTRMAVALAQLHEAIHGAG